MTRADLRRRIARLERPQSTRSALKHELAQIHRLAPYPTIDQLRAMSRQELDDFFRAESSETGPWARAREIKEQLRLSGWTDPDELKLSRAELDALFAVQAP